MSENENSGKILTFERDASFFLRRGRRYLEQNDDISALQSMRRAYAKEPQNAEIAIALSEQLNKMQRFEESNKVLMMIDSEQDSSEVLFGMASNHLALENFSAARQLLELYLSREPDGPYAEDAEDYLDLLDDDEEISAQMGLKNGEDIQLIEDIHRIKSMDIVKGYPEIIKAYQKLEKQYPESFVLQINIALAQFASGESDKAQQRLFRILKRDSKNIKAICMLALVYKSKGKMLQAKETMKRIPVKASYELDELNNLALTYLELGDYEKAAQILKQERVILPYDTTILHHTAICCFMTGKREQAREIYRRLLAIDEYDTIAEYYLALTSSEEPIDSGDWMISYTTPVAECLQRWTYVSEALKKRVEKRSDIWKRDERLRRLMRWIMRYRVDTLRSETIDFLADTKDLEAEAILRDFLMRTDCSDESKKHAFFALREMGAKEPYGMFYNGVWQYGIMGQIEFPGDMPVPYRNVLALILETISSEGLGGAVADVAARIFLYYVEELKGDYPRLTHDQEQAFAAAVSLMAFHATQLPHTPDDICEMYGVTLRRLNNALSKIFLLFDDSNFEDLK
ncbi:MAG: hypothetical protein Q4C01_01410 [Clostridia bacterium]|nr:hypothetical protein [Clostridia bacterium]